MTLRFILFFGVLLGVLFTANWLVYFSAVKFFSISRYAVKFWLAGAMFFLTASFFVSNILFRFFDNFLTRAYYFLSAFWLGLLANLVMAAALIFILRLAGAKNIFVPAAVFGLAVLYSLYGVWNAFTPDIKRIEVEIKNLPSQWQNKKIVQLSDVHLGSINRPWFLNRVAERANALNPDLIVITGDLFDGSGSAKSLDVFIDGLNKFNAAKGVYFITGNHENYLGVQKAFGVLHKTKIQIIDDKIVDIEGLQLIGIGYPEFGKLKDVAEIFRDQGFSKDMPAVLLYHTPTDVAAEASQSETYLNPATNFAFAKKMGINLQLSGHVHRGQIIPFKFLADKLFNGYDYGFFKEGDFNLYVTSGTGTWGPPMRTGSNSEIVEIVLK